MTRDIYAPKEDIACLILEWREDGGLRVHSPTHPGLYLCHPRADLVMLDILPALAAMGFAPPCDSGSRPEGQDGEAGLVRSTAERRCEDSASPTPKILNRSNPNEPG